MMIIARSFIFLYALLAAFSLHGQGNIPDTVKIPEGYTPEFQRRINHDAIDNEQALILASDGKADKSFSPSGNNQTNSLLTQALTRKTDIIQYLIETDKVFDHRLKVNYLRGLENMLKYFRENWKPRSEKKVNPVNLPLLVNAYWNCMERDRKSLSIENIVRALPYDAAVNLLEAGVFEKNPGYKASKDQLIYKYCVLHPEQTFYTLSQHPDLPFAAGLIKAVAKKYPRQLYNYASAGNKLGDLIRTIRDDPFVATVATMAGSRKGQQYFPFLDNIVKGRMSFAQVDSVESDSLLYYKLLVQTQMEYVARAMKKDTAIEFAALTKKLETKARDVFVNTINALHNEPDAVRFRCLQPLTAEELYYLAVMSDGIIYTSSYTRGVYPLMMKKAGNRGDSLLMGLHFDHYRKFISQAAAYNTLADFLGTFPASGDAASLMKAFVGKLEESDGLEDGVDVADSYASIIGTNKKLAADVLNLVKENYQRNLRKNNQKGIHIYNILYQLFLSADSASHIDLTKELGIPPVYTVPYSSLTDTSGEAVIQVFFYGDEDGKFDYKIFQQQFSNANWKMDKSNPQWIVARSARGKPVSIYANIPFDEETGEDDKAQKALERYFADNNIHPTITINRGHSYHAETTIAYMAPSSRIVFMGSCGGFHLIDAILKKSADAHIVASKQIGKRDINAPFFLLLTEKLRAGSNIDWIPFWKEFKAKAGVEGFEDYIPPYKNLGAIFIKAYMKTTEEAEEIQ
jgi:hypothetical protein